MNEIRKQISSAIQEVVDGNESPCKIYAMLKDLETVIKSGLEVIKSGAIDEASTYNKEQMYFGGYWEVRNTGTTLDFLADPEFQSLDAAVKARRALLTTAWKAKQNGNFFATQEGEEIPVVPVKKPGGQTVVFKPK